MNRLINVLKFAVVSGIGLGIDFLVFLLLIALDLSPFSANAISGTCAVTFVYFASVRRIFSYQGHFLVGLFLAYLLYQAVGVTAASYAVSFLSQSLMPPVLAKIAILPVTFSANYLFMSLLTRRGRERDGGASTPGSGRKSAEPSC